MAETIVKEETFDNIVEIDASGLKDQMKSVEKFRIVQELISNSFDEDSVKSIQCTIQNVGKNQVKVIVVDDGDGFLNWKDIFTMYGKSYKRTDSSKRGRFNLGDKQFFILAEKGMARTGKIRVIFANGKRTVQHLEEQSPNTTIEGIFNWTGEDLREMLVDLHRIIVPQNKILEINGTVVKHKVLLKTLTGPLWTELANKDTNVMQRLKKTTEIDLYVPEEGRVPWIYELGVPVQKVKNSMKWEIDIKQKVPLTTSRDVISDAWLQDLYAIILEGTIDLISEDESSSKWIDIGLTDVKAETQKEILVKKFGTEKLVFASSDHHENEDAIRAGYQVIPKGMFDGETRKALENNTLVEYASDKFARNGIAESKPVEVTAKMEFYFKVVQKVAKHVLGKNILVHVVTSDYPHAAWFDGSLTYNVRFLTGGKNFFNEFDEEGVGLLIHELSHDREPENNQFSHFTNAFLDELQRIGGIIGKYGINFYIEQVQQDG